MTGPKTIMAVKIKEFARDDIILRTEKYPLSINF